MSNRIETKTFGLTTPTHLHCKLLHDIRRLSAANSFTDERYAAFDCSVDAWHLVDWTLHSVDDDAYERLCGRKRIEEKPRKSRKTAETLFVEMQDKRLPALKYCQVFANSVKHRELRNDTMPQMSSNSVVRATRKKPKIPGEPSTFTFNTDTYIKYEGELVSAVTFFVDVAEQWHDFLVEEGLFDAFYDDE